MSKFLYLRSSRSKPNGGFTLIELLVVIAIIAILAAILFPILLSAKEAAKRTMCSNNLRQLGTAVRLYQQDYNGLIFCWSYPYGTAANPGIDSEPMITRYKAYTKNQKIFICSADIRFGYKMPPGSPYYWPHTCSYAYTGANGDGTPRNLDAESYYRESRTQAVWVFSDISYYPPGVGQPGIFDYNSPGIRATAHAIAPYWGAGSSKDGHYIKGLGCTRLYVDGHVRYCKGWQRYAFDGDGKFSGDMP